MSDQRWERDEFLVTLDLYLNGDGYSMDAGDPQIQEIAGLIDRSPGSVAFRLGNYRYLDSSAEQKGFSNGGEVCRKIWEEYYRNLDELARDADSARDRLEDRVSGDSPGSHQVETGERIGQSTTRVGQSDFRSVVRERYGDKCAICDVAEPGLLQAGHILDWSEFDDERGDPANGILLCYTHHKAFDVGMFTFSPSYELIVRPGFEPEGEFLQRTLTNQNGENIEFFGEEPSSEYIETHNENLYWWPPESE